MKRFTETNKWQDPWFRKLSPEAKLLWFWMLDNCDCAGIIEPDMDLARFQVGASKPLDSPLEELSERIESIDGKLFIKKFIRFQYGGKLNASNTAHRGVAKRLEIIGLKPEDVAETTGFQQGASKDLPSPLKGAQDKDKDKDKDKETRDRSRGTEQEFRDYAKKLGLPENDGVFLHAKFEESNWTKNNGKTPIKDWEATFRVWKAQGWLPSSNNITEKNRRGHGDEFNFTKKGYARRPFD